MPSLVLSCLRALFAATLFLRSLEVQLRRFVHVFAVWLAKVSEPGSAISKVDISDDWAATCWLFDVLFLVVIFAGLAGSFACGRWCPLARCGRARAPLPGRATILEGSSNLRRPAPAPPLRSRSPAPTLLHEPRPSRPLRRLNADPPTPSKDLIWPVPLVQAAPSA